MNRLTLVIDERCPYCRRARRWMESEPKEVPLEFVAADGEDTRRRFPTLAAGAEHANLVAVGDRGEVWRGPKAWWTALWALTRRRALVASGVGLDDPGWLGAHPMQVHAGRRERASRPGLLSATLAVLGGLLSIAVGVIVTLVTIVGAVWGIAKLTSDVQSALAIVIVGSLAVVLVVGCLRRR